VLDERLVDPEAGKAIQPPENEQRDPHQPEVPGSEQVSQDDQHDELERACPDVDGELPHAGLDRPGQQAPGGNQPLDEGPDPPRDPSAHGSCPDWLPVPAPVVGEGRRREVPGDPIISGQRHR